MKDLLLKATGNGTGHKAMVGLIVERVGAHYLTGDVDASGATNARGTPVTVTVTSQVDLVTGGLLHLGNYAITGSATMLVNH